jgi:hypothetical protein
MIRINVFVTIYCKSLMPSTKMTKVDTKMIKLVLNCAEFKLNEAIGNTKAKVDTKLIELVLNCSKGMLNQVIGNATAKLDTKLKLLVPNCTLKVS